MAEFDGTRARLYEEALSKYPEARKEDIKTMFKLLKPKKGEKILGFGEGNGYFCKDIATAIGKKGEYCVSDPSKDQLSNLKKHIKFSQLKVKKMGAESLNVKNNFYDKVWSFGALHHCPNQTKAFKGIYSSLRKGGKAVICDVFQGSKLANHFDEQVARYCVTGHEVKFLSDNFAKTVAILSGFKEKNIKIKKLKQEWIFDSEYEMGEFIYKLHAMTLIPGSEKQKIKKTINGCKKLLGIRKNKGRIYLNWPMKALILKK